MYVYRSDQPAASPLGLAACRGCEDLQLVARGSQLHIRIHTYCKHVYIPTYTDLHILHLRIHTHIYVYTPTADTHTDSLRLALLDLMPVAVARIDNWWCEVVSYIYVCIPTAYTHTYIRIQTYIYCIYVHRPAYATYTYTYPLQIRIQIVRGSPSWTCCLSLSRALRNGGTRYFINVYRPAYTTHTYIYLLHIRIHQVA